jgi:glycosyltransferase involved in cell wall biosynthesis
MDNYKKILFTTENICWGGSELLWSKTVVELISNNIKIGICIDDRLAIPDEINILQSEEKLMVFKFSNADLSFYKRVLNRCLPYKNRFKKKNERLSFILNFKPDLLVINQGYNFNGVDTMAFAVRNQLKYITISHAVNEGLWPNIVLRKKMRMGFENSVANYFVSADNLAVTQNQLGFFLDNAVVIRNPFNVSYSTDLDFPIGNDFHLACVGRYDFFAKGQDVLLQVLSIEKWKKRNLIVNFYGTGNDLENLKDLTTMYQLNNVFIHPYTEPKDIWRTNQGLILTSRFEGLPLVIVEAMLCERIAIVTNISGNTELITDNLNGFIAAAPRVEYVDEALERAWQQRLNWKTLGTNAKKAIINQIPENPALIFAEKLTSILN